MTEKETKITIFILALSFPNAFIGNPDIRNSNLSKVTHDVNLMLVAVLNHQ
jgi:hypothetical protein